MSKYGAYFTPTLAALLMAGCTAQTDRIELALGDAEDYQDFLEERDDEEKPVPFKPEPLTVSATGKVEAKPDIAVITASIVAEDKNESRAVNEMGQIINAVQTALKGRQIETGFTGINSSREFDETCRNDNRFAQFRHNEIRNDYYFNKSLDDRGDTETKRREPKSRLAQKTCFAQTIKVSTNMVIRIEPADAAGDVLRALSDAGAENSRLFGYDFVDYDALYQEAAAKAVKLAREKAAIVARVAGGTLGEIESFSVSGPSRTGRFGPQPNVIRPAQRYAGQSGSAIDRRLRDNKHNSNRGNRNNNYTYPSPPPQTFTCWNGSFVYDLNSCPAQALSQPAPSVEFTSTSGFSQSFASASTSADASASTNADASVSGLEEVVVQEAFVEYVTIPAIYETYTENVVVQEASTELVTIPTEFETIYDNGVARRVVKTPARTVERAIPAVTKQQTRRVVKTPASTQERVVPAITKLVARSGAEQTGNTNALSISLLSGPQMISATANLSYTYETPLNGQVIVEPEDG